MVIGDIYIYIYIFVKSSNNKKKHNFQVNFPPPRRCWRLSKTLTRRKKNNIENVAASIDGARFGIQRRPLRFYSAFTL